MVKKDLINRLAIYFPEFRKKDLEFIVDLLFERLTEALASQERIEIRGFGRFLVRQQKERLFTNPKTAETFTLPSRRRIIFKPGKDIKERLNQPTYASLDLGTQTFRLLMAKPANGHIRVIYRERENVRLGEGLAEKEKISPEAMERGLKALLRFRQLMDQLEVVDYFAAGTAVFRKADNIDEFLDKAVTETGIKIRVLSPEEEALFTVKGVLSGLENPPDHVLIADVGGGSTELILIQEGKNHWKTSLELGAVSLTEGFFKHDPPTLTELEKAQNFIREVLEPLPDEVKQAQGFIGTGGTASCLAALVLELEHYVPDLIQGQTLTEKRLTDLFERLRSLSSKERARLKGMDHGREDIILAGLLVYLELMHYFGFRHLVVSETGILEGLLLHLLQSSTNI